MTKGKRIKGIIIHWSDSGPKTTVEDIRKWHKARGFRDIGYNWVILNEKALPKLPLAAGELVKVGRAVDSDLYLAGNEIGAHTLGFNSEYVGICVISSQKSPMSNLQYAALINTIGDLLKRFNLKPQDVSGHRDFNRTECPGDAIYSIILQIRKGDFVKA